MYSRILITQLIMLVSGICCAKHDNYNIHNQYDLSITLTENKPLFTLKKQTITYHGTDIDTLRDLIFKCMNLSCECLKFGISDEKCDMLNVKNILFECSEFTKIEEIIAFEHLLIVASQSFGFDLRVSNNIFHCYLLTDRRGGFTIPENGIIHDQEGEWARKQLRILCDSITVIAINGNDTLYCGNYEGMSKIAPYDLSAIQSSRWRSKYPIVIIYPTCNLKMEKILQISKCFNGCDSIQFMLGKSFDCSDVLKDIPVYPPYKRSNVPVN